jgi:hypothetical protein
MLNGEVKKQVWCEENKSQDSRRERKQDSGGKETG